ncbi:MAG: hypothetical protein ACRYGM_28210 [Janthinobacterium lividum]
MTDYETAKQKLEAIEKRWSDYDGNNPDKYASEMREAREQFAAARAVAMSSGEIEVSVEEALQLGLDRAYPNAASKMIVTHEGVRYRRRYRPATKSNSGKSVRTWEGWWETA